MKDPLKKIGSKKSKLYFGNIVVQIQAKYRKDQMKTEGAYSIWKKGLTTDGQTDKRTTRYRVSSADNVSSEDEMTSGMQKSQSHFLVYYAHI